MIAEQSERDHPSIVDSTAIETGWLCAHCVHGKDVPAWLHPILAHVRQQADKCQLPVVVLPTCGRDESLVVMTLQDFLLWSHRRTALIIPATESSPDADTRRIE